MTKLQYTEVFKPTDLPEYSFVKIVRDDESLEERLRRALAMRGMMVSLSGPSKSGKTQLVRKVVSKNNLISIAGSVISSPEDLWINILEWIGAPSQVTESDQESTSGETGVNAGAKFTSGLVNLNAAISNRSGDGRIRVTSSTTNRSGLNEVIKRVADTSLVVFIDNFHYIAREVQERLARDLRAAIENGVKLCVASVPQRGDDPVRSNIELQGRISFISTSFWTDLELRQIAELGFDKLEADLSPEVFAGLAKESCSSPQLMQALCLNLCLVLGILEEQEVKRFFVVEDKDLKRAASATGSFVNFSSLVEKMHSGPLTRRDQRTLYRFPDNSEGDFQRCFLYLLSLDPPRLDHSIVEFQRRLNSFPVTNASTGRPERVSMERIRTCCIRAATYAADLYKDRKIIDWDSDKEVLNILEPSFLFYLRSSNKLRELAS